MAGRMETKTFFMDRSSKLLFKPFHLFLVFGILSLIAGFFVSDGSIDIHTHDTYYIISNQVIFWTITAILLLLWMIYLLVERILFSKLLTWMHVLLTITAIILLTLNPFSFQGFAGGVKNYQSSWETFSALNRLLSFAVIVCIASQAILIVNIILGLIFLRKQLKLKS